MAAILITFNFSRIVEGVWHITILPVRYDAAEVLKVFPIDSEVGKHLGRQTLADLFLSVLHGGSL